MQLTQLPLLAVALVAGPVDAEALVAARMIRAQSIVTAQDLGIRDEPIAGALSDPGDAIGLEARVNIYAGRPIRAADLGAPAIIERNQLIELNYYNAGLSIVTEGRALSRGGPGDRIRVMNLSSRQTVTGTVLADGSVNISPVTH